MNQFEPVKEAKPGRDYIGVGVGGIILNDADEILFIRRGVAAKNERGAWTVPGGQVDFGETLEAAMRREVLEEVNLSVTDARQLANVDHLIPSEHQHWVTTSFVVHVSDPTAARILEPTKMDRLGWFSLKELPSPLTIAANKFMKLYRASVRRIG